MAQPTRDRSTRSRVVRPGSTRSGSTRSRAASQLVHQLRSTRRRRTLAKPAATSAASVPAQLGAPATPSAATKRPTPESAAIPAHTDAPTQADTPAQVETPAQVPSQTTGHLSEQQTRADSSNPTGSTASPHRTTDAATVIGYIALAAAICAVVAGGFLLGFHISSYGLAAILGVLAMNRVVGHGFTRRQVADSRSPWVDATVMVTAAVLLIVLTAGIPTDNGPF